MSSLLRSIPSWIWDPGFELRLDNTRKDEIEQQLQRDHYFRFSRTLRESALLIRLEGPLELIVRDSLRSS